MLSSPTYIDHGHVNSPVYHSGIAQQTNTVSQSFSRVLRSYYTTKRPKKKKSYNKLKRRFSHFFCNICHSILCCSCVSNELWIERKEWTFCSIYDEK